MTGADAGQARADYERAVTSLVTDERDQIVGAEIARRAHQFLIPATYRRTRRDIPDEAGRYAYAVEYITRARAELRRAERQPRRRADTGR